MSLAGRTKNPVLPKIPYRIGGFGGAVGLANYIKESNIKAIVCATHPFAAKMPFHAYEAAKIIGIPILYLLRPAWKPEAPDKWIEVDSHKEAIEQLANSNQQLATIFLTVGRLELEEYRNAPQHHFVIRSIEEIEEKPIKNAIYITDRPPFTLEHELALLRKHRIDVVITKNSGGEATKAKLLAAREVGIPVILIKRPARPEGLHVQSARQALDWVKSLHNISG